MSEPSSENPITKIRNICILAHVDHGKTTLADHLIAACGGGVIHPKMAGRLRYMDFLDEEQRRAITMKSSSVKLNYNDHLIHLIDSPGHIDFCSEVSTAARLSDGALVLVDSVEGVHIQTHAVLRQAWIEKLTPCLVLNKIDRLITELKLTPMEAYNKLARIIHEVNSIVSAFKSEKYLSDVDSLISKCDDQEGTEIEVAQEDDEVTFQPQKGNVVFSCALDGWGFGIEKFAEFYAKKWGANSAALVKGFWGPRYYNKKKKMIVGKKAMETVSNNPEPMFVEFILKPLWQAYHAILERNKDMIEKVVKFGGLSVSDKELQNKDPKALLQSVMSQWLPLSDSVLSMVVKCLPDPCMAQPFRITRLVPPREFVPSNADPAILSEAERVRKCIEICDSSNTAPGVAFISKMFTVPVKALPPDPTGLLVSDFSDSDDCFLAFARVFCGTIRSGQRMFVLSALYDPLKSDPTMQRHVQEVELHQLYQMMGQALIQVPHARAGMLVAIKGLAQHVLKSATLSTTKDCFPFSSMAFQVAPTLRVAIEPSDPADMGALIKGLRLLNRSDPFVEINVSSRGEHVLAAAGEVHLERCIKDLRERFARVSLEVSPPLVSFKETIEGEGVNLVEKTTPNGRCMVKVQVVKLPGQLTKVLEENAELLGEILEGKSGNNDNTLKRDDESLVVLRKKILSAIEAEIEHISGQLGDKEKVEKHRKTWLKYLPRIWSLGPRQVGPNMLIVPETSYADSKAVLIQGSCHVSERLGFLNSDSETISKMPPLEEVEAALIREAETLKSSVVSGFQLATSAGPLCDEPMWGLAFIVEPYIFPDNSENAHPSDQYGIFTGQVMTSVKEACRAAVLQNNPRLVEAMYFCELNTPTEYLGPMYSVIHRRRARVLKEEMQEGSPLFTVHAYLPAEASYGFADELRGKTSGAASAILVLSHWEEIMYDPFFVPKTEEEKEEHGDGSSLSPNLARLLMNKVRRRKGLPVEEKVVQHATKQRTLARKV
ncbi:elongation factor Tu GTP-binding domain-containing protein 1 [Carex littledalei]|uniref:Elongation factor-like 1 n=1 Tax=Carex littledalei TaxID=544730 RepID=A0A833VG10_9POAL|nr:elongation factor Tu GTP-binding domain-containing protein 1 [Carex littledalei]